MYIPAVVKPKLYFFFFTGLPKVFEKFHQSFQKYKFLGLFLVQMKKKTVFIIIITFKKYCKATLNVFLFIKL